MVNAAGGGGGSYNPSGWLTTPVPEDAIPSEWEAIINARDKVPSLGKFALQAWEEMGGDDIAGAWTEMLAGDWKDVTVVSSALRNLGRFSESYADKLDSAVVMAGEGWTGNAADAMSGYFASVSIQMRSLKGKLDEAAEACNDTAFGIYECGVSVSDTVELVFDLVLTAAVALAAAAASSWTVVGGLVGAGAAAAAIIAAIAKIKLAVDAIDLAFQMANATLGIVVTLSGTIGESISISLPGDYENKAL